jgi:hypothetical protein
VRQQTAVLGEVQRGNAEPVGQSQQEAGQRLSGDGVQAAGNGDWFRSRITTAIVQHSGRRPPGAEVDVHENGQHPSTDSPPGQRVAFLGLGTRSSRCSTGRYSAW